MATDWDAIERELRAPEVWAFVTGESEAEATHISLLLDTLAGGSRGHERPAFKTFESLREWITRDPTGFWRAVVDLHSLVLGWYEDRDLFHKVGYLIAVGRTFEELVELSKGKGQSAFDSALDQEIRGHLNLTRDDVAELTYSNRKNKTSDVLLLMNVENVRATQDSSERYSFRAHAAGFVVAGAHPCPKRRASRDCRAVEKLGWCTTGTLSPLCPRLSSTGTIAPTWSLGLTGC